MRELRLSDDGFFVNKGKGIVVECGFVFNRERIDFFSERKFVRGIRRLVRNGCIFLYVIVVRIR